MSGQVLAVTVCRSCRDYEAMGDEERIDAMASGDMPTKWWHCQRCGRHLERWRGQGDVACDCGALYNGAGQRLRDDAPMFGSMDRSDLDGDGLGDLEEYERRCLAREAGW